jgi:AraC-like DNA-binding protein
VSAAELAERHTALEDLWGPQAAEWRERLLEVPRLDRRLELFERLLMARLVRGRGVHPVVAAALKSLRLTADIRRVVDDSGYSHRHFTALFREGVGLAPKRYCRVVRMQRALDLASRAPGASWAALALDAGYCDQAHFIREFRELAGTTPSAYRAAGPRSVNHVPIR